MQIVEYIMQNYMWFLAIAVVILLAIIGYYADKTNFGQGNNKNNDDENKEMDVSRLGINDMAKELDITKDKKSSDSNLLESTKISSKTKNDATGIINLELPSTLNNSSVELTPESSKEVHINQDNSKKTEIATVIGEKINMPVKSLIKDENEEASEKLKEEEFKKFDLEFNSVLPQAELISDDLLNEINDLELGKTKKLDLSDLTKFDKIELPKINSSVKNEQDIWRF